MNNLANIKIAILATDGFEQSELMEPKAALEQAGAQTHVVSPAETAEIKGWKDKDWGDKVAVDIKLADAHPENYDALLLPGGVINPDKLRIDEKAIAFIKHFVTTGKPIAAICHGPWTLIEAGAVKGREMTSWPSLKTDLTNAGAHWTDAEVVCDKGLVTSRKPSDIPAFVNKFMEEIEEGRHTRTQQAKS